MSFRDIPTWKEAPFIRILLPCVAGIIIQHYNPVSIWLIYSFIVAPLIAISVLHLLPVAHQFVYRYLQGVLIHFTILGIGCVIVYYNNDFNNPSSLQHHYRSGFSIRVVLDEPLSEKANSYKTVARVQELNDRNAAMPVSGKIIIYFQKDSNSRKLSYGTQLVFRETLQPISSTGNPAAFDYKSYCAMQGIYHQVFLSYDDYIQLPDGYRSAFISWLYDTREKILRVLRKNIQGPREAGLAEALLIGYKDNLDKELLQSYSNTGVVHVIAISGLHLGLIYWLLSRGCRLITRKRFVKTVVVLSGLWLFSFLAGGSPSILRSAVMFTFIVLGENLSGKATIVNSLSASAFLLLCFNPYWLWDAGFQLSYTAVLSLVLLMKPIYNLLFFKNPLLDNIWRVNAVTISAQIFTLPITLYYFHQFPNYFLLTNLLAVPLSSVILLLEILLCSISFFPVLASVCGSSVFVLIRLMNGFIEYFSALPLATWDGININVVQVFCLYAFITCVILWLLKKKKNYLTVALIILFAFLLVRTDSFYAASNQNKLIVYNIPKHKAIDYIDGRRNVFIGDAAIESDILVKNFHIRPSRIIHRIAATFLAPDADETCLLQLNNNSVLLIDKNYSIESITTIQTPDVIIVSHHPRLNLDQLSRLFPSSLIVFDASSPAWKINNWVEDCKRLNIRFHAVTMHGAFVMNLN